MFMQNVLQSLAVLGTLNTSNIEDARTDIFPGYSTMLVSQQTSQWQYATNKQHKNWYTRDITYILLTYWPY